MIKAAQEEAKRRMQRSLEALQGELAKLRTGRAHPSLIEHLKVSYYGSDMPLNQVASVTATDARTLLITPWEKNMVQAIEKAIMTSDLGLNPISAGQDVRVPLPALTEQRRKDLIKVLKQEGEHARVSVRNVRRDANAQVKELLKAKKITEDDVRRSEEDIQKLTDRFIADLDKLLAAKEAELLDV